MDGDHSEDPTQPGDQGDPLNDELSLKRIKMIIFNDYYC